MLGIAATVWVTLRAADPKQRLFYHMLADAPLITRQKGLSRELKVTYGQEELSSPRAVTVQLVSRGRRDVTREAFDDGKPLCLDLGTRIVECVEVTTSPSDRTDPEWAIDGSKLLIKPSHFGRRQTTVFSLLVDGESPHIVPPKQSLVDVRIESEVVVERPRRTTQMRLVTAASVPSGLGILIGVLFSNQGSPIKRTIAAALALLVVGLATAILASSSRSRPLSMYL